MFWLQDEERLLQHQDMLMIHGLPVQDRLSSPPPPGPGAAPFPYTRNGSLPPIASFEHDAKVSRLKA